MYSPGFAVHITLDITKHTIPMPSSLKAAFTDYIVGWLVTTAAAIVTFIVTWAFPDAWLRMSTFVLANVEPKVLLVLFICTAMILLVVIAFFLPYLTAEKKKLLGGIYWDKEKNPHCPSCKTPVSNYGEFNFGDWGYLCNVCKSVFNLADASGNPIKPEDARRML